MKAWRPQVAATSATGALEPVDAGNHSRQLVAALLCILILFSLTAYLAVKHLAPSQIPELPLLRVPELDSNDVSVARQRLESNGFVVEVQFQPNESIPKGNVFNQIPGAGGLVEQGGTVTILVSDGPIGIAVPNIAAQQSLEAQNFVNSSGLVASLVGTYSDSIRVGEVIATDPPAGARVGPGATISILVSQGPAPRIVPDIVNRAAVEAMLELGKSGLGVGKLTRQYKAGVTEGTVLSISPAAGSAQPLGFPISIVIADAAPKTEVPYFVGLLESSAQQLAQSVGVKLVVKYESQPFGTPFDQRVIQQGTPPASKIAPSAPVEITVVRAEPAPPTSI